MFWIVSTQLPSFKGFNCILTDKRQRLYLFAYYCITYLALRVFTALESNSTTLLKEIYVALPCILITLYHI